MIKQKTQSERLTYDYLESSLNALSKSQNSSFYFKVITKEEFEEHIKEKVQNL